MSGSRLVDIIQAQKRGESLGIASICSANPAVIEASFAHALDNDLPLLIESTCNQVNQFGGYTGYKPGQFMTYLLEVAKRRSFPRERLILGGDHLGPNPWRDEPSSSAMEKARAMVRDYVQAGYVKIHLDASMKCADDDPERPLSPKLAAERSADLAQVAEQTFLQGNITGRDRPLYVIGTEVPVPGGSEEHEELLVVTKPEDVAVTIEISRQAFFKQGLEAAWERVIAVVVQPGVEFGDDSLFEYAPEKARELARFIEGVDRMVYEAHSTDYQTAAALRNLVEDHFAILKVGPALTYAMREVIFGLTMIEETLLGGKSEAILSRLREIIEDTMLSDPQHWRIHYHGRPEQQKLARAYSFSDRIRYYWPVPAVQQALDLMLQNLSAVPIPLTLLSQYLPVQYQHIRHGRLVNEPRALIQNGISAVLDDYATACHP